MEEEEEGGERQRKDNHHSWRVISVSGFSHVNQAASNSPLLSQLGEETW